MSKKDKKFSIIIPVHEYNDTVKEYLKKSVDSVLNQKKCDGSSYDVFIVTNTKSYDGILEFSKQYENIEVLKNENNSDFQNQMNFASKFIKTEYFLFLEFDDELNDKYFYLFDKYYEDLEEDVGVVLNVLVEVDENDKPQKFTNSFAWSRQFSSGDDDMGYLNIEKLNNYSEFKFSGAFFKTSMFKKIGGLKTKIKLSFIYEFLLRVLNNGYKIFVMPKIGCKHVEGRDGSLFKTYMNEMSVKERGKWFDIAKKEYYFNNDRDIDEEILND